MTNMAGDDLLNAQRISKNLRAIVEDMIEKEMPDNPGIVERFRNEAITTAAGVLMERIITANTIKGLLTPGGELKAGAGDAFYDAIAEVTRFYVDFLDRLKNHPDRQAAVDRALHIVQHYDALKKIYGVPDFKRLGEGLLGTPDGGDPE